jgi:hypothetical protein
MPRGLESQHTSRYYFARSGKKQSARLWTKLTVACDTASHRQHRSQQ